MILMRSLQHPIAMADKVGALIDNLTSGVIFEDEQGIIIEANSAFCRMWNLPLGVDALLGRTAKEAGWPPLAALADPETLHEQLVTLASAQEPQFDQELRTSDGRIIALDYVPVRVGEAYAGCFWIYRDATERRRAEEEIRSLNHELEQRVALRTQELARSNRELANSLRRLGETQEQLIHAGKMAAVGTLVAGLSHELNNPLGIIVGYVQGLLRRMPPDAAGRESLGAVERQALRCAHLVRSLLDFSRSKPATREKTAIGPLIERVLELAAGQARQRGVELRWMARATIPEVTVCAQEIESALLNLVSNAIDATPAGGSAVVVASPASQRSRDGVEISVTDTGTGIPRGILARVFDPFFTTKPVGQGTGIGLSLTRQIVESHEGRIDVRTAEGVGTTMRLWLPLRPESGPRAGGESESRSDEGETTMPTARMTTGTATTTNGTVTT
jgi:PAS domain S-box-containing protein